MKAIINSVFLVLSIASYSQTTIGTELTIVKDTEISVLDDFNITNTAEVVNDGTLILNANLVNNGILTYTVLNPTSKVRFVGASQTISGSNEAMFYDVVFNNSATNLIGTIQVDNDADFTKGIVNNRDHGGLFFFNEASKHSNSSNESFVNGTVFKKGSSAFNFPVGNATEYRSISFENTANTNTFTTIYKDENSDTSYSHATKSDIIEFIDTNEYWEIEQTEGSDFSIIELSRNANTSSSEINAATLSDIHIVRWDIDKGYWVDEGGLTGSTPNSIKTLTQVSGYGIFALATINTNKTLPGNVVVYNNLTPNGDGVNDELLIVGIEKHPINTVEIFNRWGVAVAKIISYDNKDRVFKGFANIGINIGDTVLPSGTYFYVLNYTVDGENVRKIEYLYINGK